MLIGGVIQNNKLITIIYVRPNNRLLANRVLRVRKLIQYVAEKLEVSTAAEPIELLCGDTVLTPTMSLAAIKQHIMKSGGDVNLCYRFVNEGLESESTIKAVATNDEVSSQL